MSSCFAEHEEIVKESTQMLEVAHAQTTSQKESQAKQWNGAAVRKRYASNSDTIQEVVRSSLSMVTQKGVQPLRCDASATCENLKASSR